MRARLSERAGRSSPSPVAWPDWLSTCIALAACLATSLASRLACVIGDVFWPQPSTRQTTCPAKKKRAAPDLAQLLGLLLVVALLLDPPHCARQLFQLNLEVSRCRPSHVLQQLDLPTKQDKTGQEDAQDRTGQEDAREDAGEDRTGREDGQENRTG